jgi:hypothetical protein
MTHQFTATRMVTPKSQILRSIDKNVEKLEPHTLTLNLLNNKHGLISIYLGLL